MAVHLINQLPLSLLIHPAESLFCSILQDMIRAAVAIHTTKQCWEQACGPLKSRVYLALGEARKSLLLLQTPFFFLLSLSVYLIYALEDGKDITSQLPNCVHNQCK